MPRKTNYETGGKNYYRLRVDLTKRLGYKPDGKRNVKVFYGASRKEAEAKRDEFLRELDSGVNLNNEPLSKLMESWLFDVLRPSRKPSTIEKYEGILRLYVKESPLGNIPVKNVRTADVQQYYNNLFFKNQKSENTIKEIHKVVNAFFNYAVKGSIAPKNPCNNVSLPKDIKAIKPLDPDLLIFSDEDIEKIKSVEKPLTTINIVKTALLTGLRCGEILALTIDDINFDSKEISVTKAARNVRLFSDANEFTRKMIVQTPKTATSVRIVPFPDNLTPILQKQIEHEKIKHKEAGKKFDAKESLVFSTESCAHIDAKNLRRSFARILKRIGAENKNFHKLRHTYATKLFEQGVPLETVNALLGHNDNEAITKLYIHITSTTKHKAVQKINHILDL